MLLGSEAIRNYRVRIVLFMKIFEINAKLLKYSVVTVLLITKLVEIVEGTQTAHFLNLLA